MKKITFFLILLFSLYQGIAQTACGTNFSDPIYYSQLLGQSRFESKPSVTKQRICVEVQFHILQNSNNINVIPLSSIDLIVDDLNIAFNRHHIFFHKKGLDYIQSDYLYNIDSDLELDLLLNTNHNANALNIYIVNEGDGWAGVAPDIPANSVAVVDEYAMETTTVHEVGHAFGLYHTHETAEFGTENIVRSGPNANCEYAGDQFCSTPADPKLFNTIIDVYKVDFFCNYIGNETRNGLPYNPDTHNFMSYSRKYCRDSFTQEQGNMMYLLLQFDAPFPFSWPLTGITGASCSFPYITGPSTICAPETYNLVDAPPNSTVTWSASANLNITTQTSSYAEIDFNSNMNGAGTLTVSVNGYEVEKEIFVGKPRLVASFSDTGILLSHGYPNQVCRQAQININVNSNGSDNANWSMINSSHTTTWSQQGDDLSFYLWAVGHTATFRLSTSNGCGTITYDYTFETENCSGGGGGDDPCDTYYTVAPNPASTTLEIIQNIPPPCDDPPIGGGVTTQNGSTVTTATLYDFNGNPVLSQTPATGTMNVESLSPGHYILVISYGANNTSYHMVIE